MSEYRGRIAAGVVGVALLVAALGFLATSSFPSGAPPSTSTVLSTESVVASVASQAASTETITATFVSVSTPPASVETSSATVTSTSSGSQTTTTFGQQTTAASSCIVSGQPGPFYLRVVTDSNQTPIAGAHVTATNEPASCDSMAATSRTTLTFTTNNTEWYALNSQNNAGFSLVVTYAGQAYNFTAYLRSLSLTCASLYIPSGNTDILTTEFQTTCPATISTATSG